MYTPTTEVVRTDYIRTQFTDVDKAGEEFDRWLAEAKAEAWQEGYDSVTITTVSNPYRQEGAADHE